MRVIDCFLEIFAYVSYLVDGRDSTGAPSFELVQQDLGQLMQGADETSAAAKLAPEDFQSAKFAVCAWVDEVILTSTWAGRNAWLREPLQRRYFETANAGEEFLARLQQMGPDKKEVREVYLMCLALGFTGPYYQDPQGQLEKIKQDNLRLMLGENFESRDLSKERLFPGSYPSVGKLTKRNQQWGKRSVLIMGLAAASPIFVAVLYFMYRLTLNQAVADFFKSAT